MLSLFTPSFVERSREHCREASSSRSRVWFVLLSHPKLLERCNLSCSTGSAGCAHMSSSKLLRVYYLPRFSSHTVCHVLRADKVSDIPSDRHIVLRRLFLYKSHLIARQRCTAMPAYLLLVWLFLHSAVLLLRLLDVVCFKLNPFHCSLFHQAWKHLPQPDFDCGISRQATITQLRRT